MFKISTVYRNKQMKDVDFYVVVEEKNGDNVVSYNGFWITRNSKRVLSQDTILFKKIKFSDWKEVKND